MAGVEVVTSPNRSLKIIDVFPELFKPKTNILIYFVVYLFMALSKVFEIVKPIF